MVGEIAAFDGFAAILERGVGIPAIAADEGAGDAQFAGLLHDLHDFSVIAGEENDVGVGVV